METWHIRLIGFLLGCFIAGSLLPVPKVPAPNDFEQLARLVRKLSK